MSKGLELIKRQQPEIIDGYPTGNFYIGVTKEELDELVSELKSYEELTNKPVVLCGRTHGQTQALIDTICKNYKEVKITCLEDEKKVKAFEIIKKNCDVESLIAFCARNEKEQDLLKEVLR